MHIIAVRELCQATVWDFTVPKWNNYIAGGVVNHNSGKTKIAAYELARVLRKEHPTRANYDGGNYAVLCLTRKQAAMVWAPMLLGESCGPDATESTGLIPTKLIKKRKNGKLDILWNRDTHTVPYVVTLTNGKTLYFGWHGVKASWEGWQGADIDGLVADEAGEDTEQIFNEMHMRLAVPRSKHKGAGWVMWAATPTTINETLDQWRDRALDPKHPEYVRLVLDPTENPALSQDVIKELRGSMSDTEAAIRIDGTASRLDTVAIFPMLNEDMHILKSPHVSEPDNNVAVSYDPGISDNSGIDIWECNKRSPKRWVLTNCIRINGGDFGKEARTLITALGNRRITWLTYDKNGANKREHNGQTMLAQFLSFLEDPDIWHQGAVVLRKYRGQIDNGIRRVIECLRPDPHTYWEPMLATDIPNAENGIRQWWVEMKNYRLKKPEYIGEKLTNANIHKKANESADLTRYIVMSPGNQWTDFGRNWREGATVAIPDSHPEEEAPGKSQEELEHEARMKRSAAIAARAARGSRQKRLVI